MKKRRKTVLSMLCCVMVLVVMGCGQKEQPKNDKKTIQEETNILEGTLSEKKDFMFVVEDGEKKPYALAFSEKPEGYDELKVDDHVSVEYTGELSEVDAFTGKVISIKRKEVEAK